VSMFIFRQLNQFLARPKAAHQAGRVYRMGGVTMWGAEPAQAFHLPDHRPMIGS
jgi:hypothetical protein